MGLAKTRIREFKEVQWDAADLWRDMMKHMWFVLTALGRRPGEGESAVPADGAYSVSREERNLAQRGL